MRMPDESDQPRRTTAAAESLRRASRDAHRNGLPDTSRFRRNGTDDDIFAGDIGAIDSSISEAMKRKSMSGEEAVAEALAIVFPKLEKNDENGEDIPMHRKKKKSFIKAIKIPETSEYKLHVPRDFPRNKLKEFKLDDDGIIKSLKERVLADPPAETDTWLITQDALERIFSPGASKLGVDEIARKISMKSDGQTPRRGLANVTVTKESPGVDKAPIFIVKGIELGTPRGRLVGHEGSREGIDIKYGGGPKIITVPSNLLEEAAGRVLKDAGIAWDPPRSGRGG